MGGRCRCCSQRRRHQGQPAASGLLKLGPGQHPLARPPQHPNERCARCSGSFLLGAAAPQRLVAALPLRCPRLQLLLQGHEKEG